MILIGQYDSPFVRRVGIALRLYGLEFKHRPWSAFSDLEKIRAINPLIRVPVLVLDDGLALTDSHLILDYLDGMTKKKPLFPREEPARHHALRIAGLAAGMAEKAVALYYERRMHKEVSADYTDRCIMQIASVMNALEGALATNSGPFWAGDELSHVDIMIVCALRFISDAHPNLVQQPIYPALSDLYTRLEADPIFQEISQPFIPPN